MSPLPCTFLSVCLNHWLQVKNYHRSTVIQDSLNGFATPNINCGLARKIDFFSIMNAVSDKRARKSFVE
jgi:hypothetical protein